jgi:hypothetical protein
MKLNISDLLDDYMPEQEPELIGYDRNSINLKAVKRLVNKKIVKSKGGQIMRIRRIAAACIVALAVLTIGSITVNAATKGALFHSIKVLFVDKHGIYEEMKFKNSYTDENGNKVTEYTLEGVDNVVITISGEEAVTDGIIVSSNIRNSISEAIGINVEKYKQYEPGTYEESNKNGKTYIIEVSEDGTVLVKNKE